MGEDFLKEHGEVAKQVKADPASVDLRAFIQDELDGCLFSVLFNQQDAARGARPGAGCVERARAEKDEAPLAE